MTTITPRYGHGSQQRRRSRPAINILRSMARLLTKRQQLAYTRGEFLRRWGELRRELGRTPEYRKVRREVYERAKGRCEECHTPCPGSQGVMHHIRQVSFAPQHALTAKNCRWWCRTCHETEHPWLKR